LSTLEVELPADALGNTFFAINILPKSKKFTLQKLFMFITGLAKRSQLSS
jgi:hypothetical protein